MERTATMSAAFAAAMLYGAPAGLERLSGRLPADPERAEPADVDLVITRGRCTATPGTWHQG